MAIIDDFLLEWNSPDDYICANTSGSTGTPKQIRLLKRDMQASARATNQYFGITSGSVLGLPLSVEYIAGKMMCVRAIEANCELYQLPVSNHLFIKKTVDLLSVVPSQVDSILAQKTSASLIKNLLVGGAPLDNSRARSLCDLGIKAFATYGMTETCSHVALADLSDPDRIYRAMPGITFGVDNRSCLIINAPAFSFGSLVTNDIVELSDKLSFRWIGRYDNIINSGAIKISPEQLENEIRPYIDAPFYVVAYPDRKWGEVPAIVFEGEDSESPKLLELLHSFIDHRRCPKHAFAVDCMPKTSNGKIIRKKPQDLP